MINNNLEKNNKNLVPEIDPDKIKEINNLTEMEIALYKEAFQIFDKHSEGYISSNELGTIMSSLGFNISDEDLNEITNIYDNDQNNNMIDFISFLGIISKKKENIYKEEDLIDAFRIFDKEGNGKISSKELLYVMMSSGEDFNENYIKELISESSMEHDEFIDYQKFVKLLISAK
jgi:calmodulin